MSTNPQSNTAYINPDGHAYATDGKIMLATIVAIFAVVFLVASTHLYCRWRQITRQAPRRNRRQLAFPAATSTLSHRGLDPTVAKTLPVVAFSVSEDQEPGEKAEDCAVCLSDFEDGENVRCLPACGHRFHVECIDMWFYSHSTCPLCRSAVQKVSELSPETVVVVVVEDGARSEETKSPASPIALLRRILSFDVRGGRRTEMESERGEFPASLAPDPARLPELVVLG